MEKPVFPQQITEAAKRHQAEIAAMKQRVKAGSDSSPASGSASAGGWEAVNHPTHYGGADDAYESIKVIEAWKLGFHLGNTVKYISRAERKGAPLQDLKKAAWYLAREIERRGGRQRQNSEINEL